ncbi:MAG: BMP family ABC transporter substrate-binding protein [spirochete symbiont of Stewartia floridana]|nr:MAG: BMP family ABC transporter substrate-binding protein [spirochete symbiont of Stewartia floridana]
MKKALSFIIAAMLISGYLSANGEKDASAASEDSQPAKLKAGFIYIGPAGDFGWTYAHDQGRLFAEEQLPWLETVVVESVPEGDAVRFIDRLVQEQKADVVFTTSFGYMEDTIKAAQKYPEVKFFHCSGFKRTPNLGTYMADMYQIYYLNGLMAGSITESNKIGYVAAFPIPELFRHMNAFALGIKEVNPEASISVKWIYAWYGPDKAREAAQALVAEGADVLGFTEDTPTVIEVAQEYQDKGRSIYALSHYSPMQSYGPDASITGQLTDWGPLYVRMLQDTKDGKTGDMTDYDLLWLMEDNVVELGASWDEKINAAYVDQFKQLKTDSSEFGSISIYDLVMKRHEQMSMGRDTFDPFVGPIFDQAGNKTVADGEMATIGHLFAEMSYQLDNFDSPLPQ